MKQFLVHISILFIFSVLAVTAYGQMPFIRAGAAKGDIRDGLHFKKGAWTITPGPNKNTYYVEFPRKNHRVTFYTDIDSVHFDIDYGGLYSFAVILNNRDTCFTQVIAAPQSIVSYSCAHDTSAIPDTIPFRIGNNNRIYVKGSVHHSGNLNFRFDLGSAETKIKGDSLKSGKTILRIGTLHWDSVEFRAVDKELAGDEDGVIGNALFQDKIVKIDYDKQQIILYETMPETDTGYSRHEMILDGVVPMIQAGVATQDTTCMTWFVLGTGDSRNSFIDGITASKYNLYRGANKYLSWGNLVYVKLPELKIANVSFMNISSILARGGYRAGVNSVLGNGLLKRFNLIVDNREGLIYIQPNYLRTTPFDNDFLIIYGAITVLVILSLTLIFIAAWILKNGRKKRII